MNVKKIGCRAAPAYPTKRQFFSQGMIVGAAAVTLGTMAAGCSGVQRTMPRTEPVEVVTTAGVLPVEPQADRYVVQSGDTLYGVAKRRLGDGTRWREIEVANPGVSPRGLKVGQTLIIPDVSAK